jgi:hypothetical protein
VNSYPPLIPHQEVAAFTFIGNREVIRHIPTDKGKRSPIVFTDLYVQHSKLRGGNNMERKILSLLAAIGMLLWVSTGTVYAGVGPSPFQPQLNKLHSIQLNMAVIQKSLDTLVISTALPRGTSTIMSGIKYDLNVIDSQLDDLLATLPAFSTLGDGQKGIYLAIEGIRMSAKSMEDPVDNILSRLGIGPSPFKEILGSISDQVSYYSNSNPPCVPGTVCQ